MIVFRFIKMKISFFIKSILFYTGFFAIMRRRKPNKKIAILRYHAVVERAKNDYTSPSIAISPRQFEKHVRYFTQKYNVISLDEAVQLLRNRQEIPENSVVFTFDDGYADNYQAYKILKKYEAGATIYLTAYAIDRRENFWLAEITILILGTVKTSFTIDHPGEKQTYNLKNIVQRWRAIRAIVRLIKSNDRETRESVRHQVRSQLGEAVFEEKLNKLMLTWEQIKEMQGGGMIFGAHTLTHLNLPNAQPADALAEISECKSFMEEKLGSPIQHFSYPNSGPYEYFTPAIREMVEKSGYISAVTSAAGFADSGNDFFAIKRVRTVPSLVETVAGIEFSK
ncbi:MAG: hypothetical protein DWQ05_18975 [Calditrichaeota bacterium]|nr:MAG: hypothetical protein DWQ05_18975 [Calditrichota bacterium]